MKIGKTDVDNNLIFAIIALIVAYIIINKITSGISSGVSTLLGENPEDKENREKEEKKSEIANYSPLAPQYHGSVLKAKKFTGKQTADYIRKISYTNLYNRAKAIDKQLHGIYISDEDANKIIRLLDELPNRFQISYLAGIYPKVAGGANLESDIQKYLDEDEKAELFKRINKKPIM